MRNHLKSRQTGHHIVALFGAIIALLVAALVFGAGAAWAASYNNWSAQTSGTTTLLRAVAFPDASNGWVVGSSGLIRHSANGGTSWSAQTSGTTGTLRGVSFVGTSSGWVVGSAGFITHTTNGGTTWTAQTSGTTQNLYAVCFTDANNGWAVGAGGTIRHTTNGGTTWTGQTSGATVALYGVTFADANNGWVVGSGGTIRHTTNGGTTWTAQTSGTTQALYGLCFVDAKKGWACGGGGTVRSTTNGGTTWTGQTSGTTQTLYNAAFVDGNYGWVSGNAGTIRRTVNGGSAWSAVTSGTTQNLRGMSRCSGTLWAVGGGGVILTCQTDTTPPVTTATGLQADNHTGWTKTAQNVTFAATDAQSGVAATYYTIDAGAQQLYTGAPVVISVNGSHTITYYSTDIAANAETVHTGYVNIDTSAPTTTATNLQATNTSGWVNSTQTVSLAATDALSGVASTSYTVDGGATLTYGAPFAVVGQGSHPVAYWSTDALANAESHHTGYVNIDLTAPTVTNDADAAWHNAAVIVHLKPVDTGGSGVAGTEYRAQGATTWLTATGNAFTVPAPADGSNDGARVYEYRALDAAGNTSATGTCTVRIDTQGPVVTPAGLEPDQDSGWRLTSQTVTLAAADEGSGPSSISYTVDGSATQTYSAPFVVSGTGQHPIEYWATDALGNTCAHRTGYVNISNPFAQASGLATSATTGWRNSSADVTVTAVGDDPPLNVLYQVDSGSLTLSGATATFVVGGEGNHVVAYYARNSKSVESVHQTGYVNIDLHSPTTTAVGLQPDDHSGWQAGGGLVSLDASDALSGVAATMYTVDGGSTQVYTGVPFAVAGNGSHVVTYQSTDLAGNSDSVHTGYVNIDATAPTTTATGLQSDDHSGWRTTSQSVTLSATDALSGVATSYYTVDGGAAQTYAGAFSVSGLGSHAVTCWSVDRVGNLESAGAGYVNIDTTAPTTTASGLQADDHSGWQPGATSVTLNATDSLSGVATAYYTVDGGSAQTYSAPFAVAAAGSHVVTYYAVDVAGNPETPHTGYVNIDTTAPTTTATGPQADDHSGWRNSSQSVTLAAVDTQSGVAAGATSYTVDGGDEQVYAGAFNVSGEGSHPVTYWSVDNVGNVESAGTGYVNIDATPPTVGDDGDGAWHNSDVTVHLTAGDSGGSGVAGTQYRALGASTWNDAGGNAFTVLAPAGGGNDGAHPFEYRALDAAGNASATGTCTVRIDTQGPSTSAGGLQADDHSGWRATSQSVTLAASDALSGVATTSYKIDGGSWQIATGAPVMVGGADGSHMVRYFSTDAAGNIESESLGYVNMDASPPATTAGGLQADDHSGWRSSAQTVTLHASDALSGVAVTLYTVDGSASQAYMGDFSVAGPGSHKVTYWSTDAAGTSEAPNTGYVNIDATPPTVGDDGDGAWHNSDVTVHLTAGDSGGSGVAGTQYRALGASTWNDAGGNAFTVLAPAGGGNDGAHPFEYRALDAAGNASATGTCTVRIDTQGPSTSAGGLQADDHSGWRATSQSVTLAASDALSGVATTYYTVDGGAPQTYVSAFSVSGEGQHPVEYWAVDALDNVGAHHTGYVNISDPYAQAVGLDANAYSAWRSGAATVTLSAGGTQGPMTIHYQIDGGGWQTADAPATLTVSADGAHQVDYYATNSILPIPLESIHQTGYVSVDSAAPVTTATGLQADAHSGWTPSGAQVTLTSSDVSSGVAAIRYTVDSGAAQAYAGPFDVAAEGSHVVTYWAVDAAGNTEVAHSGFVNVDKTAPATTAVGLQPDALTGWRVTAQSVSLSAADARSGVVATFYTVDGAGPSTYTAPFDVGAVGSHVVTYWSSDAAGNVEAARTGYVNIADPATPLTSSAGLSADKASGWRNSPILVTLTATGGHGALSTRYTVDGGTAQTYSAPFTVSGDGSHVVTYWSSDAYGDREQAHTAYANIDTARPAVVLKAKTVKARYLAKMTIKFKVTDPSCATCTVKLLVMLKHTKKTTIVIGTRPSGVWTKASVRCKLKHGRYSFSVIATDLAGNTPLKPVKGKLNVL